LLLIFDRLEILDKMSIQFLEFSVKIEVKFVNFENLLSIVWVGGELGEISPGEAFVGKGLREVWWIVCGQNSVLLLLAIVFFSVSISNVNTD
jgi:hypothetical protein